MLENFCSTEVGCVYIYYRAKEVDYLNVLHCYKFVDHVNLLPPKFVNKISFIRDFLNIQTLATGGDPPSVADDALKQHLGDKKYSNIQIRFPSVSP